MFFVLALVMAMVSAVNAAHHNAIGTIVSVFSCLCFIYLDARKENR